MAAIKVKAGTPQTMDAGDNPTFDQWFKRVDAVIVRHFGIGADDLPDIDYMSLYEERVRPIRAANKALRNAGADYF